MHFLRNEQRIIAADLCLLCACFAGDLWHHCYASGAAEATAVHLQTETAFRAFSALVRMSTGDSWSLLFADAIHNPHVPGIEPPMAATVYFFFVFYMAFMQWVLVSIFVAIIAGGWYGVVKGWSRPGLARPSTAASSSNPERPDAPPPSKQVKS